MHFECHVPAKEVESGGGRRRFWSETSLGFGVKPLRFRKKPMESQDGMSSR